MSRDIWSPDDETVDTGVTNSMRRYQSSRCEQVNSIEKHKVPAEIVREIKELNKTKQPRGFWACYAKTHCITESAIYHIRTGRQYKDVV